MHLLLHKRQDFRNKIIEGKIYLLIFSTIFVQNISHSKKNSSSSFTGITTHYGFLAFSVIRFYSALSLHCFL